MASKTAIIIGAGPAGLTAAYELLTRTDVKPIIIEKSTYMGGLSRTVLYKGNRIDIGPHRFFSKSDRVMDWWFQFMPMEASEGGDQQITYHHSTRSVGGGKLSDPDRQEHVFLTLNRRTRIYYLRKFFDYPISLQVATLRNLGLMRTMRIGFSYMKAVIMPIKPEENLEQFFTNRFGKELYLTFFKDYTEKVWGIECHKISADWGAQRIKGLSVSKALFHAARKLVAPVTDVKQKNTETSLVEKFLFPKLGTGQLWEEVARQVVAKGGEILTGYEVDRLHMDGKEVKSIDAIHTESGEKRNFTGDYFFSTMPIKELIRSVDCEVPGQVKEISEGLVYRDFVEVGLLVNKLKVFEQGEKGQQLITDNWIYIQESDVKVGRMQIWNNWGPSMVADPTKVWLGLEYFVYENDEVWNLPDDKMIELAAYELEKIGLADRSDVIDAMVLHVPKTYPGYFGSYDRFPELQNYIDQFTNLFLVGRNGQHKYNNQDHSMLASMVAVDNIANGITTKDNIWAVNTEMEYHEEKNNA